MSNLLNKLPHIGQLFVVGFKGTHPHDEGVKEVVALAKQKCIGGVILFKHNMVNLAQIKALTSHFKDLDLEYPLFIAIDQEGGHVQRFDETNGSKKFPSAYTISQNNNVVEAVNIYDEMAKDLCDAGFNVVFGPVVDLHSHNSQIIGKFERSFSPNPATVVTYAKAYIEAFKTYSILTCLKHFPGHGFAEKDSHKELVDITHTHQTSELVPFQKLVEEGYDHMIMSAHVMHRHFDNTYPATLSKPLLKPLLNREFKGVFITDDLMMGAIGDYFPLDLAVSKALSAGNDIVLLSWNKDAAQGNKEFKEDSDRNNAHFKLINAIGAAIENNEIDEKQLQNSINRIIRLKHKLLK